jgi:hypothetical protein
MHGKLQLGKYLIPNHSKQFTKPYKSHNKENHHLVIIELKKEELYPAHIIYPTLKTYRI